MTSPGESNPPLRRGLRRGVYIIPTLFTVGNIFCGYWSVVLAYRGEFMLAAIMIFVAAACDALDGRIARLTRTTSEFGEQYDSLCDVVSFGFAPALIAWKWGMPDLGRWGFFGSFLFLICGSMRLARFNIMVHRVDKRFFVGLPIPAGAGVVASIIFWHPEPLGRIGANDRPWQIGWAVLVVVVGLLMISTIRYRSFKDVDLRQKKSVMTVLALAVGLALIAADPERALAISLGIYALSGPVARLFGGRRRNVPPAAADEPPAIA